VKSKLENELGYATLEMNDVTMLSHYMNNKGVHMGDEDEGQTALKRFMQRHKNVTCYRCGKKGHYRRKQVSQWGQR
jgi:uncharacterized paraquat-inducible protein A